MHSAENTIDSVEASKLTNAAEPSDTTRQAIEGLKESSSDTVEYYRRRRAGESDYNTDEMVKVGALPPKPAFFDPSAENLPFELGDRGKDNGSPNIRIEEEDRDDSPNIRIEGQEHDKSPNIRIEGQDRDTPPNIRIEGQDRDKSPNIRIEGQDRDTPPNIRVGSTDDPGSSASNRSSIDLKSAYERNQKRIDKDGDGLLSKGEIDDAMHDKSFKGEDAEFVALLKKHGDKIQELHDDEIGAEVNGVSFGDISKLYEMRATNSDDKLVQSVEQTLSDNSATLKGTDNRLFGTDGNITPDAVRQGEIGDCYFLAAAASLAANNPEAIKNMIKDNGDGTYTVTFPGDPEHPVTVDAPTEAELAHYARGNEHGTWPAVLEKAYGKHLGGTQDKADGGAIRAHGVDLLSPNGVDTDVTTLTTEEELDEKLQEAMKNGRPVTSATTNRGPLSNGSVNDQGLVDGHIYSVVAYNAETKMVTVRNPWGHGEPTNADGTPKDGKNNGQFEMPLSEFKKKFNRVSYGQ